MADEIKASGDTQVDPVTATGSTVEAAPPIQEEGLVAEKNNNTDSVIVDSSNSHLEKLSISALFEKRKALLWMANSGGAMAEAVSFSKNELAPIEEELRRRGVTFD